MSSAVPGVESGSLEAEPSSSTIACSSPSHSHEVTVAEARRELGGRVTLESALPGLANWARVRDYRLHQIGKLPNVEIYRESRLDAGQILEFGFERVILATGSAWRRDGIGRALRQPLEGRDRPGVLTPDDLLAGSVPAGPVLIYDDDHYYLGSAIALLLAANGNPVTLVSPAESIARWSHFTDEHLPTMQALIEVQLPPQALDADSALQAV